MPSVPAGAVAASAQAAFAAALFDEFARAKMTDVVVCAGSRSTPLVLAAHATAGLRLHVRLDERSAGFFAIGRALATGRPVGVVVTSGTAAAELTAAVVEADLAEVPLVVVTADRPPELRGVGAPQTIDQVKLFGAAVRRHEDPGPIRPGTEATWRAIGARLMAASRTGPVHLNVPLVEPLDAAASAVPAGRDGGAPWHLDAGVAHGVELDQALSGTGRAVVVAGRGTAPGGLGASITGWGLPILADPLSGARSRGASVVAGSDALLRDGRLRELLRPDVVVLLGAPPASKALADALVAWRARVIAVTPSGRVADPHGVVTDVMVGRGPASLGATAGAAPAGREAFLAAWQAAEAAVQGHFDAALADSMSEPGVARMLSACVPTGTPLVASSSMPVRDLEWFGAKVPEPAVVLSNRGANGIDGVVSTTLGVAVGGSALGLLGDLAFLHDAGALADGTGVASARCVLVVLDNHGGGIFSFLPQRSSLPPAVFERLFATPPSVDVAKVAAGYGADVHRVGDLAALQAAVAAGLDTAGVTVVVADVPDRDANVELHRVLSEGAAAAALAALGA